MFYFYSYDFVQHRNKTHPDWVEKNLTEIHVDIKLIENEYESMTLNIANEDAISTKELIAIIYKALGKKPSSLSFPQAIIKSIATLGNIFPLPINSEKLNKITSSFVVDTAEMIKKLGFSLPETTRGTISSITKK